MHVKNIISTAILLATLNLIGCVSLMDEINVTDYVRNRASYDFSCAKEKIQVDGLARKVFAAVGCGKKGIYACVYTGAWFESPRLECKQEKTQNS